MALAEFILLMIAIIGLFAWNRAEGRADARHMDTKIEAWRTESTAIINAIKEDMKDFHERLLEIQKEKKG